MMKKPHKENQCTGCMGCDYIATFENDKAVFCKLVHAGKETGGCADPRKPFIWKNGRKVYQPLRPLH